MHGMLLSVYASLAAVDCGAMLERHAMLRSVSSFQHLNLYVCCGAVQGLPVRGQRTKTNARTRKGKPKTVAGKKK
jgi:small subunit ribosomal protein S13